MGGRARQQPVAALLRLCQITAQGDLDELLMAEGLVRVYGMHVADNLGGRKQGELGAWGNWNSPRGREGRAGRGWGMDPLEARAW
jgi:hypothetical protein